jgi:single-stranded-DNA-specific exonuclease
MAKMHQSKTLNDSSSKKTARGKQWQFPTTETPDKDLLEVVDNSTVLAALLMRRGVKSAEQAKAFLDPQIYRPTSAMELPDVEKALVRITQAIELREHITVYGDYDVDGVTATSVLLTVLKDLGASVDFYIPNRAQEGYGLNLKAVSILASKHRTKLIITCDCGVSNFAEINLARSLGVDTLVLDHHLLPELMPPAVAIVHPKLLPEDHPLFHLPGVGVAYKVCEALLIDRGQPEKVERLLDFVTLGMIADLVPLVAENRYLVQIGLPSLIKSERPGIRALLAQVKKSDDTDLVGFGLAPRINAVGRLSEAKTAVELLTTSDPQLAEDLSHKLASENARRQEICERIFVEAEQMVNSRTELSTDRAIAIYKEGWHHGVVGIVASRLVEKFGKPVFIAEFDPEENLVKGSARSVDGVDLFEVLKANEHLLTKWGGHKMAAGFSVSADKADALCRALVDTCNRNNGGVHGPTLKIDLIVDQSEVSLDLARTFFKLAPFGMGNKKPLLCVGPLLCQSSKPLGREGKHHRIMLKEPEGEAVFEAVMWNSYGQVPSVDDQVDIVCTPEVNAFNGRERLQLVLSDWRYSGKSLESDSQIEATAAGAHLERGREEKNGSSSPIQPTIPDEVPVTGIIRSIRSTASVQKNWKDLREHSDDQSIVKRALEKFGNDLNIFVEGTQVERGLRREDRSELQPRPHLIVWQFPPSLKVFQEILERSQASHIYLLGTAASEFTEVSPFVKQLLGMIRFAVSKKDGKVSGEKLCAAFGTTKMALALGLSLLKKLDVIDWYAEDGEIYLDLYGSPEGSMEELIEYRQLGDLLGQIDSFRKWCANANLKEIQLATMPNQIELLASANDNANIPAARAEENELTTTLEREEII